MIKKVKGIFILEKEIVEKDVFIAVNMEKEFIVVRKMITV